MSAAISLRGVAKRYGAVQALKPLDLEIAGGTLVTLLGPSGCGKTTLLRMIAGLEAPTAGRILIGGEDVTLRAAGERDVSMVFQSYALFPHMTVLENVAYGLISMGVGRGAAAQRAEATLAQVGLSGFGGRQPSELSGGQQQRVAVARSLILEPAVLLFDEPLSNLDARLRRTMRDEIRALQQRLGLTAVYVTHDQAEALAVSDRIVVMRDGEIAQVGSPEALYMAPESVFVATVMGEAYAVRGRIEAVDGDMARVALADLTLRLPARGLSPGPCDVVIRPEALVLGPNQGLPATIERTAYMGSHTEYWLASPIGPLFVVASDRLRRYAPGEAVRVGLAEDGVVPEDGVVLTRP